MPGLAFQIPSALPGNCRPSLASLGVPLHDQPCRHRRDYRKRLSLAGVPWMAAVGMSLIRRTGAMSLRSFSRSLPPYALQQPFHVSRHLSAGDESLLRPSYGCHGMRNDAEETIHNYQVWVQDLQVGNRLD